MFKKLGLSSEQVCEIGKWKNVGAFTSHYLRLGASETLGHKLTSMLHKVSPLRSADPDLTLRLRFLDLNFLFSEGGGSGSPRRLPQTKKKFAARGQRGPA